MAFHLMEGRLKSPQKSMSGVPSIPSMVDVISFSAWLNSAGPDGKPLDEASGCRYKTPTSKFSFWE